jgi:hypothetical protein
VANRIQKVLEDANIKLGSVASDVLGVFGRAMLDALVTGLDQLAARPASDDVGNYLPDAWARRHCRQH